MDKVFIAENVAAHGVFAARCSLKPGGGKMKIYFRIYKFRPNLSVGRPMDAASVCGTSPDDKFVFTENE